MCIFNENLRKFGLFDKKHLYFLGKRVIMFLYIVFTKEKLRHKTEKKMAAARIDISVKSYWKGHILR